MFLPTIKTANSAIPNTISRSRSQNRGKSEPLEDYTVPGVPRAAFSHSDRASIVLFVQQPGKDFEPRFLVDESAKSIENSLGATVKRSKFVPLQE